MNRVKAEEDSAKRLKECAPMSQAHTTSLDSKRSCILGGQQRCGLGDSRATLLESRVPSQAGKRQAGGKGGEAWNLWEGRRLTHP